MEAARQHLGPEAQLRDVQMVWPFVVPKEGLGMGRSAAWVRVGEWQLVGEVRCAYGSI